MKVLFSGYAPVHFLCFKPVYDRLRETPDVEVTLSGGTRSKSPYAPGGYLFDHETMYRAFDLPEGTVQPVGSLAKLDFDVMFAANTRRIEPRKVRERVQIFHGMSFRNRAIRPETDGADHYFLLGPYMKRGFEDTGLLEPGDPRAARDRVPQDRPVAGRLARPGRDAAPARGQRRPAGGAVRPDR